MGYNVFEDIIGKIAISVERTDYGSQHDDAIIFEMEDGSQYKMYHEQDCCEGVSIEDIDGPLDVLVGSPFVMFEASFSESDESSSGDSETWTFYKMGTLKGSVTVRWYGSSNGYYSETAQFVCSRDKPIPTMHSFFS